MQGLQRLAGWGATAAAAVLVVVLASRSEIAADRIALVLHHAKLAATPPFDAAGRDASGSPRRCAGSPPTTKQIKSRLAAVEHDMDDVTGSITKQIKAADASRHVEDGPSVVATAAASASMLAPAVIPPATCIRACAHASAHACAGLDQGGRRVDVAAAAEDRIRRRYRQRPDHPSAAHALGGDAHRSSAAFRRLAADHQRHAKCPRSQPDRAAAGGRAASRSPERRRSSARNSPLLGLFCQPTIFDGQHLALR